MPASWETVTAVSVDEAQGTTPNDVRNVRFPRQRMHVFNVPFDSVDVDDLVAQFDSGTVIFHNLDTLLKVRTRPEFRTVCRRAEYSAVDGQVLAGLLRVLWGRPLLKASGSDFLPAFCEHHAGDEGVTVFLLGAGPGVAAQAADRINERAGRQIVVGSHTPSYHLVDDECESREVVRMINASGATTLAVGLGAPKQEGWIARHKDELIHVDRFMAVGATLDFQAGRIKRAPAWMSRVGLEWFYRLVHEPRRLWRRYLWEGPQLTVALIGERLRQRTRESRS